MKKSLSTFLLVLVPFVLAAAPAAQKVETVDGVRVVHNVKGGLWGKTPKVALELVRKIGDVDTEDEHVAFNYPSDVAVDKAGNIYVLDTGNARVQKFGPDGRYLATVGRKGQGPGEFIMPDSLDIDKDGNLVVADSAQSRVHVIIGDGKDARSLILRDERVYGIRALPSGDLAARASTFLFARPGQPSKAAGDMRLFLRLDPSGRVKSSFGLLTDFGEPQTTSFANSSAFDVDGQGALLASFRSQNRVEKYDPEGRLVWRADRPLAYSLEVRKKGKIEQSGGNMMMAGPEMNTCSEGIAVDAKGRAWVVTMARQLRKEEEVQTSMMMTDGGPGGTSASVKTEGNTDLRTTDAFKLEIFDPDGVLLGELPLTHFADVISISGDSLFLVDRERGVTVYEYRIVEK